MAKTWLDAQKACCAIGMTLMYLEPNKNLSVMQKIMHKTPLKPSLHLIFVRKIADYDFASTFRER
jgi:hypothetical protein